MLIAVIAVVALASTPVYAGYKCNSYVTTFGKQGSDTEYYSCEEGTEYAVLKTCDEGQKYDPKTSTCQSVLLLQKRGGPVDFLERKVVGEIVEIGTLFDQRTEIIYNGFNMFSEKTLKDYVVKEDIDAAATFKIDAEKEFTDKRNFFNLGASLELSFLGGLISVKGSAEYLNDDKVSQDKVRVVMSSSQTTYREILDIASPDFSEKLCKGITKSSGPTHVVTEIQYGTRAVFVFEKDIKNSSQYETVHGELHAEINAIPGFKVKASVAIDVNGTNVKNLEDVYVKFYGDSILSKVPSTYTEAIVAYKEAVQVSSESFKGKSRTPLLLKMTPISKFCNGEISSVITDISESLQTSLINAINELKWANNYFETLTNKDVALRYASIRKPLITVQTKLKTYTNFFIAKFAQLLPEVRAGNAEFGDLNNLISNYTESAFEINRITRFLKSRDAEIIALTHIISDALKNKNLYLTDSRSAAENECLFNSKLALNFKLNLLPENDVGTKYLENFKESQAREDKEWFQIDEKVQSIGAIYRNFRDFLNDNMSNNRKSCYMISLGLFSNERMYEAILYNKGTEITRNLVLPSELPTPKCVQSYHDGFDVQVTKSENEYVKGIWVHASTVGADAESYMENEAILRVKNLQPNMLYTVSYRYGIYSKYFGRTYRSQEVNCTTRITSPPAALALVKSDETSIEVSWSIPSVFPPEVYKYIKYTVTLGKDSVTIPSKQYMFTNLQPGTPYDISVVAVVKDQFRSNPSVLSFATSQQAPGKPKITTIKDNSVTFSVDLSQKIPEKAIRDLALIRYTHVKESKSVFVRLSTENTNPTFTLSALKRNVTYSIQVKSYVRYKGILIPSAFTESIDFKTTASATEMEKIQDHFDKVMVQSREKLAGLTDDVNELAGERSGIKGTVTKGLSDAQKTCDANLETSFEHGGRIAKGVLKGACIQTGVMVSGGSSTSGTSLDACARKCAADDECDTVSYQDGSCILGKTRPSDVASALIAKVRTQTVNLYCLMGLTSSTSSECFHKDKKFSSGTKYTSVSDIQECLALCGFMNDCEAIGYNAGDHTCTVHTTRSGTTSAPGVTSVSLFCPGAAISDENSPCVAKGKRYTTTAIGSVHANSVKECAVWCAQSASCLFASFDGSVCAYHSSGKTVESASGQYALSLKCMGINGY